MADQKDQHTDSPAEESTRLPFKKRDGAEKPLPGLNRDTETMSSDINNDGFFFPTDKKMNLDELQKKAYYEVLQAFFAESSTISGPKIMIIKELKNTWKITKTVHTAFDNQLKTDTLVQELRETSQASYGKETEKVTAADEQKGQPLKPRLKVNEEDVLKLQESFNVAPAKIQEEEAEPSSTTPEDSPIPSWGDISPACLVNKWVNIRVTAGENDYVPFLIADYDAETEMHQLVTSPRKKVLKDPCDWIDIRYIPEEDIAWQEGHPGIPTHKFILKPGETTLHATSTAREKKQIKEVRKAASGIPIISKVDKGKSMA